MLHSIPWTVPREAPVESDTVTQPGGESSHATVAMSRTAVVVGAAAFLGLAALASRPTANPLDVAITRRLQRRQGLACAGR